MTHENNDNRLTLPLAVALAGVFIGAGIYLGGTAIAKGGGTVNTNTGVAAVAAAPTPANDGTVTVSPVTAQDHIRGNRSAKAIIVEYSDLECPFCKQFHKTVKDTVAKFGANEVAWVYRHFPLDALHSKARKEAEATECAAELGGNDGFWAYIDRLIEVTPANNGLDAAQLPVIAEYVGLNRSAFEKCLNSGKYAAKVEEQYQSGVKAGARGTPYSVIVTAKGNTVVNGAVPAASLEESFKQALGK